MTCVLQVNRKTPRSEQKQERTAEERSQGLGCRFWKGYFFHVMDAIFVNEPGSERRQIEDEAFLKLFNKRQKDKR